MNYLLQFYANYATILVTKSTKSKKIFKSLEHREMTAMSSDIKTLFEKYGGVMRTKELNDHGFYDRKIKALISEGLVEHIRRGYYQYVGDESFTEIAVIKRLFPDGIICMESALDYYGYTDRVPSAWNIAVDNMSSRERFSIDYPIVKPHYINAQKLNIGLSEGQIDGVTVRVYDRERTICDCMRDRNKMDAEVFSSVIQGYLKDSNRNTANLGKYATLLHVEKKVREVIGIWL